MNPATLCIFEVFATERKKNINTDKVEKKQQYIPGQKLRKKYCKKDLFSIYTVSIFIYIFLQTPGAGVSASLLPVQRFKIPKTLFMN